MLQSFNSYEKYIQPAKEGIECARKALDRHEAQEAFTQGLEEMLRSQAGTNYKID